MEFQAPINKYLQLCPKAPSSLWCREAGSVSELYPPMLPRANAERGALADPSVLGGKITRCSTLSPGVSQQS